MQQRSRETFVCVNGVELPDVLLPALFTSRSLVCSVKRRLRQLSTASPSLCFPFDCPIAWRVCRRRGPVKSTSPLSPESWPPPLLFSFTLHTSPFSSFSFLSVSSPASLLLRPCAVARQQRKKRRRSCPWLVYLYYIRLLPPPPRFADLQRLLCMPPPQRLAIAATSFYEMNGKEGEKRLCDCLPPHPLLSRAFHPSSLACQVYVRVGGEAAFWRGRGPALLACAPVTRFVCPCERGTTTFCRARSR